MTRAFPCAIFLAYPMMCWAIKGGVKSHKITVQGAEQKGDLGYAYGRWEADAGGTNVLMNEGRP